MATLEGQTIAGSYKDLLQVSNSNSGVDTTARAVSDGEGTATLLYVSTTEVYSPGTGGSNNTAFGINAGDALATNGDSNTVYGAESGTALSTADRNVAIGHNAFYQATTGADDNVVIGYNAMSGGFSSNAVDDCVIIGSGAAAATLTSTASGLVAIGMGAGAIVTSGAKNVLIGFGCAPELTTGEKNTAVGYQAMFNSDGDEDSNTCIGYYAGAGIDNANSNTIIGDRACGSGVMTGDGQTIVGQIAAQNLTSGALNTMVGSTCGSALTTGTQNVFMGAYAGDAMADDESYNVAIGVNAMGAVDQGSHASADADYNVAIGQNALLGGDFGSSDLNLINNVAVGNGAMDGTGAYTATHNVFVGNDAGGGSWSAEANSNVGIGSAAMDGTNAGASNNVAIGYASLSANLGVDADYNIAIGSGAMGAATTAYYNVCIGKDTGTAMAAAVPSCVIIGHEAGDAIDHADAIGTVAIGRSAGGGITSGQRSTMIGYQAGLLLSTGDSNTGVGYQALVSLTSGAYNTAFGDDALGDEDTGGQSTAVGVEALGRQSSDATEDADNTAVGMTAGKFNILGQNNTSIGSRAMRGVVNNDHSNNTAVGKDALFAITTGGTNVAVGTNAMLANTEGSNNVAVGHNAGAHITEGLGNVCIGVEAGDYGNDITTGNSNTLVGAYCSQTSATANDAHGFGYNLDAETAYTTLGNGSADIRAPHGNVTWATVSDERVKKDITDSTAGLNFVNALRPRTFKYKTLGELPESFRAYEADSTEVFKNTQTNHGFIAQEVKTAIDADPNLKDGFRLWDDREDGSQEVGEAALIPMLVKAIQELTAKVKALEDA